jgi:hypothetical protein
VVAEEHTVEGLVDALVDRAPGIARGPRDGTMAQ